MLDSARASAELRMRPLHWLGHSDARQVCDLPAAHPSFHRVFDPSRSKTGSTKWIRSASPRLAARQSTRAIDVMSQVRHCLGKPQGQTTEGNRAPKATTAIPGKKTRLCSRTLCRRFAALRIYPTITQGWQSLTLGLTLIAATQLISATALLVCTKLCYTSLSNL